MTMNRTALAQVLVLSAVFGMTKSFTTPTCPKPRFVTTRGIAKSNAVDVMGLGLFRRQKNGDRFSDDGQQCKARQSPKFSTRISHKLRVIRSVLSSRLFGGKKRCLSIIAAALIAAGANPSQVIAQTSINPTALTKVVTASIRTSMESEIKRSMERNSFLQYNRRAPNNYFEDVSPKASVFDTSLQAPAETSTLLEEMDGHVVEENDIVVAESSTTAVETVAQAIGPETDLQANDGMMILNDKMVKTGAKNIAIVGSGGTALLVANKKVLKRTSGVEDDDETDDGVGGYDKIISVESEIDAVEVAGFGADHGSVLPLTDKVYVQARQQPKSPRQEAMLAEKYAAIESVEERAYQILIDLGMVEVR